MKSLMESILDTSKNVNQANTSLVEIRNLCKNIEKVLHKYWDDHTENFTAVISSEGVEDATLSYQNYESVLYKIDTTSLRSSRPKDMVKYIFGIKNRFISELNKIPGINIDVVTEEDMSNPYFSYSYINIENFDEDKRVWKEKNEYSRTHHAWPQIVFLMDADDKSFSASIGVNTLFMKKPQTR